MLNHAITLLSSHCVVCVVVEIRFTHKFTDKTCVCESNDEQVNTVESTLAKPYFCFSYSFVCLYSHNKNEMQTNTMLFTPMIISIHSTLPSHDETTARLCVREQYSKGVMRVLTRDKWTMTKDISVLVRQKWHLASIQLVVCNKPLYYLLSRLLVRKF